jgi:uncharacterized protein (TIGR01777 family)
MKYLITGGTGLIGQALIERLSQQDASITVLTRNIKKARKLFNSNITLINSLSIYDIEHCDVVINLAGEAIADKRWSQSQKNKICKSRWNITLQIKDFIKKSKHPPHLFMSGSAIGIYGRQGDHVIDEEYPSFNKEFTHDVCAKWEAISLSASSDITRVAVLRTGIVLSNKGGALDKMYLPFKMGGGGKIGNGKQFMSWIHIEDMINGILHIINDKQLKGAVNLTAPYAVTNRIFSETLAKQLKRPCFCTIPEWVLKLLLGEMSDLILYGQNVVPKKLLDSGFTFAYPKINQAFEHLF